VVKDDPEEKVVGGGGKADDAREERGREGITFKIATTTFRGSGVGETLLTPPIFGFVSSSSLEPTLDSRGGGTSIVPR
jgi:hypothetical protein